ncbi:hypothetical protein [Actinopolymorpha cephalotaxi]|uniref:hypothetical protein n=1 Tax=Actinopolymorpha cephalotaxi TaxID=504797 RepID=UPI00362666AA
MTHFGPTPAYSAHSRCSARTPSPSRAASWSTRRMVGSAATRSTIPATRSAVDRLDASRLRARTTSRVRNSSAAVTRPSSSGAASTAASASAPSVPKTSPSGRNRSVIVATERPINGRNPPGRNITPSTRPASASS